MSASEWLLNNNQQCYIFEVEKIKDWWLGVISCISIIWEYGKCIYLIGVHFAIFVVAGLQFGVPRIFGFCDCTSLLSLPLCLERSTIGGPGAKLSNSGCLLHSVALFLCLPSTAPVAIFVGLLCLYLGLCVIEQWDRISSKGIFESVRSRVLPRANNCLLLESRQTADAEHLDRIGDSYPSKGATGDVVPPTRKY